MKFFVLRLISLLFVVHYGRAEVDVCSPNTLAVYKIRMDTHWSENAFPKQYPRFRPAAQFSRLLGMVHNSSYVLWREGDKASMEVRAIAERGSGELLEQEKGVRDVFAAPRVPEGVGSTESVFYSDAKHTKVSVISKIVPSPDWFVGLDSFELCLKGYWLNNITIEAGPIDAGTDNGFTFTAPNWPAEPPAPISYVTAHEPSHPANSFHYPDFKELPPLVTFHIIKERVFKAKDTKRISSRLPLHVGMKHRKPKYTSTIVVPLPEGGTPDHQNPLRKRTYTKRLHRKSARRSADCVMSPWTTWSACSVSCGVGVETRSRRMLMRPRRGGTPCPKEISQTRWCGEQTNCIDKFFNW